VLNSTRSLPYLEHVHQITQLWILNTFLEMWIKKNCEFNTNKYKYVFDMQIWANTTATMIKLLHYDVCHKTLYILHNINELFYLFDNIQTCRNTYLEMFWPVNIQYLSTYFDLSNWRNDKRFLVITVGESRGYRMSNKTSHPPRCQTRHHLF